MTSEQPGSQPLPEEAHELIAQMVQRNYDAYAANTQKIIDDLNDDLRRVCAELALVRECVGDALRGPFMPTPSYLERLLWPTREQVDAQMQASHD